jgi:hypothetical protein
MLIVEYDFKTIKLNYYLVLLFFILSSCKSTNEVTTSPLKSVPIKELSSLDMKKIVYQEYRWTNGINRITRNLKTGKS